MRRFEHGGIDEAASVVARGCAEHKPRALAAPTAMAALAARAKLASGGRFVPRHDCPATLAPDAFCSASERALAPMAGESIADALTWGNACVAAVGLTALGMGGPVAQLFFDPAWLDWGSAPLRTVANGSPAFVPPTPVPPPAESPTARPPDATSTTDNGGGGCTGGLSSQRADAGTTQWAAWAAGVLVLRRRRG